MEGTLEAFALDQSKSSTGWAAWKPGWDLPRYGSERVGSEYTGDGQTFTKMRSLLIEWYQTVVSFDHLFYEEPIAHKQHVQTSEANLLTLVGLRTVIEGVGYELRCRSVKAVDANTWKLDFCGRGEVQMIKREAKRAQISARDPLKAATMERCRQLGMRPRNDNEGDAIGILTYGLLLNGVTPPWIAAETLRAPLGVVA